MRKKLKIIIVIIATILVIRYPLMDYLINWQPKIFYDKEMIPLFKENSELLNSVATKILSYDEDVVINLSKNSTPVLYNYMENKSIKPDEVLEAEIKKINKIFVLNVIYSDGKSTVEFHKAGNQEQAGLFYSLDVEAKPYGHIIIDIDENWKYYRYAVH